MKTKHLFWFFLSLSLILASCTPRLVKVACVGDSITWGAGIRNRPENSYPVCLGKILGDTYKVYNFGLNGRTMLKDGDYPYEEEGIYECSKDIHPDIVVIMLGTNDTKPQNWKGRGFFGKDYADMIGQYASLPSHPKVYLCFPPPAYAPRWGINDSIIIHGVIPVIDSLASAHHLHIIDLYHPMSGHPEWFSDQIHPDTTGAGKMAEIIANELIKH